MVNLHSGILLGCKEEKIKFYPLWHVDGLESIMLSEISQWEKDKYHMISLIHGI